MRCINTPPPSWWHPLLCPCIRSCMPNLMVCRRNRVYPDCPPTCVVPGSPRPISHPTVNHLFPAPAGLCCRSFHFQSPLRLWDPSERSGQAAHKVRNLAFRLGPSCPSPPSIPTENTLVTSRPHSLQNSNHQSCNTIMSDSILGGLRMIRPSDMETHSVEVAYDQPVCIACMAILPQFPTVTPGYGGWPFHRSCERDCTMSIAAPGGAEVCHNCLTLNSSEHHFNRGTAQRPITCVLVSTSTFEPCWVVVANDIQGAA